MKILSAFTFVILVFVGCTSAEYQTMQNERNRLRAAHEDALRKHDPRQLETALTDKLIGTWQFLDIEVAEGDVSEEVAALKYKRHARLAKISHLIFLWTETCSVDTAVKLGTQR